MLWVKAFHIISMVAWFAGLFYLPRLFVYHAEAVDEISLKRFEIMEWRLLYGIMTPAAIATTAFGLWMLISAWPYYKTQGWMHAKLTLVVFVWIYHLLCAKHARQFALRRNQCSAFFFRVFNEVATLLLIPIVIFVVVKPF